MPRFEDLNLERRSVLDDIGHKQLEEKFGWTYKVSINEKLGWGQCFDIGSDVVLESFPAKGTIRVVTPEFSLETKVTSFRITDDGIGFYRKSALAEPELGISIGANGKVTLFRDDSGETLESGVPARIPPQTYPPASIQAKPEL